MRDPLHTLGTTFLVSFAIIGVVATSYALIQVAKDYAQAAIAEWKRRKLARSWQPKRKPRLGVRRPR